MLRFIFLMWRSFRLSGETSLQPLSFLIIYVFLPDEVLGAVIIDIPAHPALALFTHSQRTKEPAIILIRPRVSVVFHPGEIFERGVHITFQKIDDVLIEVGVTTLLKVPGLLF